MDFEKLLKELKTNLLDALGEKYQDFSKAAKKDIEAFLKESKVKLKRWAILLAEEKINQEEFEWLVKSQKDLLVLQGLYQAGISKIALGHLKNKIIKIVIDTVKVAVLA
ncbi:hypothetical protein [Pseudofulvibacter geojedonensis]|uniref:Uncharacterized protein n=1 Tax=Pseudofulvibacter geojedonensis TaxID=1123758 RepID=A0ABW3I048_9FLAO